MLRSACTIAREHSIHFKAGSAIGNLLPSGILRACSNIPQLSHFPLLPPQEIKREMGGGPLSPAANSGSFPRTRSGPPRVPSRITRTTFRSHDCGELEMSVARAVHRRVATPFSPADPVDVSSSRTSTSRGGAEEMGYITPDRTMD